MIIFHWNYPVCQQHGNKPDLFYETNYGQWWFVMLGFRAFRRNIKTETECDVVNNS